MTDYIHGIGKEKWNIMSDGERLAAIVQSLMDADYWERCDGSGLNDEGVIVINSIPYMYAELSTVANHEYWRRWRRYYGLYESYRTGDIQLCSAETMEYLEACELVDDCRKIAKYPVIDDDIYYSLEEAAFERSFNDEFYEGEELKPEYRDIGQEKLREIAWDCGCIEADYFYIDMAAVEKRINDIRRTS